jgi:phosphoglycolate phosphatase-like HAD superfamily hydrolase
MVSGLKGVAFDVDGVIFDSKAANRKYYNLIRERLGLPPMNPEQEDYVHMHAVKESLAFIVPEELWPEVPAARKSVDYREVLPELSMEPGLKELLYTLRSVGLRTAVYTNRTTTLDLVLDMFGLRSSFDLAVSASEVRAKPHPDGMQRILSFWRTRPVRIAYVGDSEVDAEVARRCGVPFWAYKNHELMAQMFVDDFFTLRSGILKVYGKTCFGRHA